MQRDVIGGTLLIAGAVAGMTVMGFHPTARDLLDAERFARQALLNVTVHSVALAAVPALFLGLLAVARRLGPSDLTTAAIVIWGFGGVAILSAAIASGFVSTGVLEHIITLEGDAGGVYHALGTYTGLWNQGFAKVNIVASSVAILLWSAAILTSRRMPSAAGAIGAAVGAVILLGFFAGHIRPNVHGFGFVVFVQSGWLIWLGILLCRKGAAAPAS